ncbi:MAG: RluA family pseudouridine synthase [Deltaproteobacteria bacterium]|nr:RluA family pseudouridine synthase [Deltaproteobacteria bacterium]
MKKNQTLIVPKENAGERLDLFITGRIADLSRSAVKNLLDDGRVLINDKPGKPGHKVKEHDVLTISLPEPKADILTPEEIPLQILYEDADIIVVNKPADLAVHPGAGRSSGTLVNALLAHTKELSRAGGPLRRGIVHRLDKDTTGALVIARNDSSHANLAKQFKEHTTGRKYVALVWGSVKDAEGIIDMDIGRDIVQRKKISVRTKRSRRAITHYKVLKRYPFMTLLELSLKTGRTHQIRVHLTAINHPVVGDQVYGKRQSPSSINKQVSDKIKEMKRQCLHAMTLGLKHPGTGAYMEFTAPFPEDMAELLRILDNAQ